MASEFRAAKDPTWQARLVVLMLRQVVRARLVKARTPQDVRRVFGRGIAWLRHGCEIQPATIGGVRGEWIRAPHTDSIGTLLYLHGGGYVACSPVTHRAITCAFARAGLDVFAPDYRLAPEHPYPAALHDSLAVYNALLQQGTPVGRFAIAGDSAGGGLTLATLLSIREQHLPAPAAAVLFSPFTDLTGSGASLRENLARCAMFDADTIGRARQFYVGERDARDPYASPLFADLRKLPPLLIHVSNDELLRDDSIVLARNAEAAGTDVKLVVRDGLPHVWPLFKFLPETRATMQESVEFLRARFDQ